ncbi:phage portal protein [Corallococcus sp. RDP092CA]|uniref:phage portal protein n=1 Tax=Corallococcus sp. RDP092CA TaxID=3109369 RepID=UPI0035B0BA6C
MTVPAEVHQAEERLQSILKAVVVGARVDEPASRPGGEDALAFSEAGALQPPYEPEALCLLVEHSNSLRQNVDAYATNIDGFGFRFEPAIDFDADGAQQKVADAMALERAAAHDAGTLPPGTPLRPTDEDVAAHAEEVRQQARVEKARLESFFDFCCFDSSFVELRRRTRHDLEVTGNAYWEVLRDGKGDIARFVYVPSYTVRLLPLDKEAVEVRERVRISAVSFDTVTTRRRLRRYIQVQGSERVYFKSFGDSRVISRLTGRAFKDVAALKAADASDGPSTELIHFAIHSPRSPYGIPRWVGTLLSVLGSRQMEEVNYLYFNNKSVPPLALLVSGGRLSDASVPRIERFIEENLKGKANFHKILILEADGTGDGGRAKIELRPLTDAQQQDALFQAYDARNIDKVGSAFRLPPLLRGDGRDFNRSVAEAQLRFAEDQVFQPERDEFDFLLRTAPPPWVLPELLARTPSCARQAAALRPPTPHGATAGTSRPSAARPDARRSSLSPRLAPLHFPERHLASEMLRDTFQTSSSDLTPQKDKDSLLGEAKRLLGLREELRAEEERLAQGRLALARRYMEDTEHIPVPREEFDTWFSGQPT